VNEIHPCNQQNKCMVSDSCGAGSFARASQVIEGEFTFAYNKPFQLTATLNVGAGNGGMADFSLTSLTSSLALPTGVQLVSASGYFAQAVPEPETWTMLLAGLGLVGYAARRRGRWA
jgi:hypothetical protein